MPPADTTDHVLSDHRLLPSSFYHKIGLLFLCLCLIIGVVYAGYAYYAAPLIKEDKFWQGYLDIQAAGEANPAPFEYRIVPDAIKTLQMAPPSIIPAPELLTEFSTAHAKLAVLSDTEPPLIYDMPLGDLTYIEYINNLSTELQAPLFQMHDELRGLVVALNTQYPQETLAARLGQSELLVYPEAALNANGQTSVYPSQRVAEAHFIGEVLARQFPSDAANIREFVDQYIVDGVGYGHYTLAEAMATRILVDAYISGAVQNEATVAVMNSLE